MSTAERPMPTEVQRQALEDFDDLWIGEKINLLGVMGDFKPATWQVLKDEPQRSAWGTGITDEERENMKELMHTLGLKMALGHYALWLRKRPRFLHRTKLYYIEGFFVSKSTETAHALRDAVIPHRDEGAIGRLLGYPETAVQAWVDDDLLPYKETEKIFSDPQTDLFLGHRVSRTHWRQETAYVPEYQRYIRAASPKLYDEFLRELE